jgi:hypothetical protein
LEFDEHQLVKDSLFGNSLYFKLVLVKGLLDTRDPLFLMILKIHEFLDLFSRMESFIIKLMKKVMLIFGTLYIIC